MLCQRCRRVATITARQVSNAPRRAQSTIAPMASPARFAAYSRLAIRQAPGTSFLKYSTSSEAASASASNTSPTTSNAPSQPQKPDYLDEAETTIWDKLTEEFSPTELTVQDISGGCGSMYGIEIASEKFRGTNMLKQQRMVNAVLGEQMKGWHGVQLRTKVPS
jgi:stress-induced morphogen